MQQCKTVTGMNSGRKKLHQTIRCEQCELHDLV